MRARGAGGKPLDPLRTLVVSLEPLHMMLENFTNRHLSRPRILHVSYPMGNVGMD